jgi:hypothetical protein
MSGAVETPLDDQQPLDRAALDAVRRSFPANREWESPERRTAMSEILARRMLPRGESLVPAMAQPPISGGSAESSLCPATERHRKGFFCARPVGHTGRHRWRASVQGGSGKAPPPQPARRPARTPSVAPPVGAAAGRSASKVVVEAGGVTITVDMTEARS